MRSAARISKKPAAFRRDERSEAQRLTRELHRELAHARAADAEWYVWIRDVWRPRRAGEVSA